VLALGAVAVVFAFVGWVIWQVRSSTHPVETATLYASYLAATAIAVTLLMALGPWWWRGRMSAAARVSTPEQVDAAADRLAEATAVRWRTEATARRIVTPAPVSVRWRWAAEVATSRLDVISGPVPGTGPQPLPELGKPGELLGSGVVTRLHDEVYARLPHGRLVLLGGPGAGKTAAMLLLLLAALDRRSALDADRRARVPIPVWLTLGGWDPATTPLRDLALGTMNRDYPALRAPDFGPDAVTELLLAGRVALFLDGLDEMPDGMRSAALKRVDDEAGALRVVMTSRPVEYLEALAACQPDNTAVIELRPVRPEAAAAYLLHGQAGAARQRWERLGNYLIDNPGSVVARALDNPLNLSLARDTYLSQDPVALTDPGTFPTVAAVREHLIDQFLITAYPSASQRAHAIRWLAWIALHMGASQDLPWWEIPAWIPRWKFRLARGIMFGLGAGIAVWLTDLVAGEREASALQHLVIYGSVFGLVAALGTLAGRPQTRFRRLAPGERRFYRTWLTATLGFGLWFALFAVFGYRTPTWALREAGAAAAFVAPVLGLISVLVGGLGFRFAAPRKLVPRWPARRELRRVLPTALIPPLLVPVFLNLWASPIADSPSATAAGIYRADRRTSMIYGLMLGFPLGFGSGLLIGHLTGPGINLWSALTLGLGFGLLAIFATGQVPVMKLTEVLAASPQRGRVNFLRLLEDASRRQVLRQAGALYQFRHAAIQHRLAAVCCPPRSP
jgi:hypothetical protein